MLGGPILKSFLFRSSHLQLSVSHFSKFSHMILTIVDNGDNDGNIFDEIVKPLDILVDTSSCKTEWYLNGKCES